MKKATASKKRAAAALDALEAATESVRVIETPVASIEAAVERTKAVLIYRLDPSERSTELEWQCFSSVEKAKAFIKVNKFMFFHFIHGERITYDYYG